MPNFEVLDARIASALNRIIQNSQFKRRISLEEQKAQKQDSFLRGRQIAYLIHEYFRVSGANDSVENYADLFTVVLRNDDIQEFDSKWDGILLSMTKIPPDDILEGLHKLRTRESEEFKTVLDLYDLEIHQKKLGPDYHRLKTVVKISIEQDIRNKNVGARNGNYETNAVVKNQGTKQRGQRILGNCWQWEHNGQCSRGDNCSFRHDINKRGKLHHQIRLRIISCSRVSEKHRESEVPVVECLDGLARITSKELAPLHSVKNGILQYARSTSPAITHFVTPECLFHKTKSGCRFGEKCSYAHRQVDEQLSKRSRKNDDNSAVAMLKKGDWHESVWKPVVNYGHDRSGRPDKKRDHKLERGPFQRRSSNAQQLGCVFQDMKPPKSILQKSTNMQRPIQRV